MIRSINAIAALAVLVAFTLVAPVAAQVSVTGEWAVEFTTPRGPSEFVMYLTQEGPRLTGHLTSEFGEASIKGSINGDQVKLAWSTMEAGKPLEISVTATAKGETMTGKIQLGTIGEGAFSAERTGSR